MMKKIKEIRNYLSVYFASIEGKARVALFRVLAVICGVIYFGIKFLFFGFKVPLLLGVVYSLFMWLLFFGILFKLKNNILDKILEWYVSKLLDYFDFLMLILTVYIHTILMVVKVPLWTTTVFLFFFSTYSMGAHVITYTMGSIIAVLCIPSFFLCGLFLQALEYCTVNEDTDKTKEKSIILDDLLTMRAVFSPFESYYPLKFATNDDMQLKANAFVQTFADRCTLYQEKRGFRSSSTNYSHIRNFIIVNGKFIGGGIATGGGVSVTGWLINEERKRQLQAAEAERNRQLQAAEAEKGRQLQRDKWKHAAEEREKERQHEKNRWESEERQNSGFLSGLFGSKRVPSGPKSSLSDDFFFIIQEFLTLLHLIPGSNNFFILAVVNLLKLIFFKI